MNSITTPFEFASTTDDILDGLLLAGRRVLVTGGGSGLGLRTAEALASREAEVTITVRSAESRDRARAALAAVGRPVQIAELDLTDRGSIHRFLDGWTGPLDVLVNNAGGILPTLARTADGWEQQFAMNHLGHFELARGLRAALADGAAESGDSRIVTLSSSGHLYSPVVFDDIHFRYRQYSDILGYGQAKTANVLFGVGATNRWSADGIFANAAMPGPTLTGFQRNMSADRRRARLGGTDPASGVVPPGWKSLDQGAATPVFLAASPLVRQVGGRYFENSSEAELVFDNNGYSSGVAPYALDQANADRLWDLSERMLG